MASTLRWIVVNSALLLACCYSSLAQTTQSLQNRKIVVESFDISGTQAIDSAELAEITNSMAGSTFDDDAEELQQRIRAQFQDHGYFKVEVQKLDIKVIDPLASPEPVRLEAQVSEGSRVRLSSLEFTGNHALSSQALRDKFPIKIGDQFARSKIATGLEKMRDLYSSMGFLDATFVPGTILGSDAMKLTIAVEEGSQYRMDKLEILGPAEVADKLQTRWQLAPGAVFDASYTESFVQANISLLPRDFTQENDVELFADCRDATVSVHFHLKPDPQHAALDHTRHVNCPEPSEKKKN
jgi:outer membrane protein assembly factor BamA